MPLPRISIITPSYNQARFLEETICSVLDQGYPNLEYIVIDGGSNDGSTAIIERYSHHLSYWVSEPDRGQSHALNKGIARVTGDILGWQNSDDVYLPGSFARAAQWFGTHRCCDVLYGDIMVLDEHSEQGGYVHTIDFHFPTFFYENTIISNQAMFWRAEIGLTAGPFDEALLFSMDYDFICRLLLAGATFGRIGVALGAFRKHEQAKTANYQAIMLAEGALLRRKYFGRDKGIRGILLRPWLRLRRKCLQIKAAIRRRPSQSARLVSGG